jgi:hypothetical protein
MTNQTNLSNVQIEAIKKAYRDSNNRMHGTSDQNTICQSIGQMEALDFMVDLLGLDKKEIKKDITRV